MNQLPPDKPVEAVPPLERIVEKQSAVDFGDLGEIEVENGSEEVEAHQEEPTIRQAAAGAPASNVQTESATVAEAFQIILEKLDSIDHRLSEIEKKLGPR